MKAKDKAIKLLRLAQDQAGTPEGESAQAMAEAILEKHGLTIEPEDLEEEEEHGPDRVFFEENEERIDWREMLLVTLCDIAHGGVVVPIWGHDGQWQLWVLVDEDVDTKLLRLHYQYLCSHIERLIDWKQTRAIQHHDPDRRSHHVKSFALGAMAYIGETLLRLLSEEGLDLEFDEDDLPFVYQAAALPAAADEPETNQDLPALFDSFADQVQGAQQIFKEKLPAPYEPTAVPEENIEVFEPSWPHFDEGRRMAALWVREDVLLPEEEDS